MDEQPVKRKPGRPKGSKNKPGHHAGRVEGSGRPRMDEVLKQSGEVEIIPPSEDISRPATALDLSRKAQPVTLLPTPDEPGAVPAMIQTILAIRRTVDLDNPVTLYNAMEQYINLCAQTGMKITNGTMYMACGVSKETIHTWEYGTRRQNNPAYREFATMCKMICAAAREQYGVEGQVNPILTIFHQKYFDGFTDAPQQEAAKDPLGEITDPAKLAEKYKDIIVD